MMFGALLSKYDIRDYKLKVASNNGDTQDLPETFTLEYQPEVKDQSNVSSCVAHVCASIEEYFEKYQCNTTIELSPGFIYGTRYDYTGEGMYLRDALKTLCEKGICTKERFPYNKEVPEIFDLLKTEDITDDDTSHYKISRYFICDSIDDIKNALYNYGPVMFSVPWYKDNKVENDTLVKGQIQNGNHAIYIYGWNQKGFLFQNSWGRNWAQEGRCILPYDYPINEAWGITDDYVYPHDVYIYEPKRNAFLDLLYRIINLIVNIFKKHD